MAFFSSLTQYLDGLETADQLIFATEDVCRALPTLGVEALRQALDRQRRRGRVLPISRGSGRWVVVPLRYARAGAPPIESWIHPYLADGLNLEYYVGLLSAAAIYGAAPYGVMSTQIVTARNRRPVCVGPHRLDFHANQGVASVPTRWHATALGGFWVSTPEATALEVIERAPSLGGLGRVREVLQYLWPACTVAGLEKALDVRDASSTVQRLGHLLMVDGETALAKVASTFLASRPTRRVALDPEAENTSCSIDPVFNLAVPAHVEWANA